LRFLTIKEYEKNMNQLTFLQAFSLHLFMCFYEFS